MIQDKLLEEIEIIEFDLTQNVRYVRAIGAVRFYLMKNSEQKIKKVVIIPTYNEVNIKFLLDKLVDLNLNCLIIDDGSPDGTAKVSEHRHKKYIIDRGSKNGYASACIEDLIGH